MTAFFIIHVGGVETNGQASLAAANESRGRQRGPLALRRQHRVSVDADTSRAEQSEALMGGDDERPLAGPPVDMRKPSQLSSRRVHVPRSLSLVLLPHRVRVRGPVDTPSVVVESPSRRPPPGEKRPGAGGAPRPPPRLRPPHRDAGGAVQPPGRDLPADRDSANRKSGSFHRACADDDEDAAFPGFSETLRSDLRPVLLVLHTRSRPSGPSPGRRPDRQRPRRRRLPSGGGGGRLRVFP